MTNEHEMTNEQVEWVKDKLIEWADAAHENGFEFETDEDYELVLRFIDQAKIEDMG